MSFSFDFLKMAGNYQQRVIGRIKPKNNKGIGISTCYVNDMDEFLYETALLDATGAHPVERYKTSQEAIRGHKKWIKKTKSIEKVIMLGSNDGIIRDREIEIKPVIFN